MKKKHIFITGLVLAIALIFGYGYSYNFDYSSARVLWGKDSSGAYLEIGATDSVAGNALPTISKDYAHHEIEKGKAFYVMYSVASLGAMTTPDDMITLDFTTPDTTKWGHFTFAVKGSAGWRVRLIEAPTGGAATPTGQFSILNHNRNSAIASTFTDGSTADQVNYDSTLATGGTTLWDEYMEGSGGPQSGGTGSGARDEIVLKQNTKYQASIYGTDASAATLYINWYEHTDN